MDEQKTDDDDDNEDVWPLLVISIKYYESYIYKLISPYDEFRYFRILAATPTDSPTFTQMSFKVFIT